MEQALGRFGVLDGPLQLFNVTSTRLAEQWLVSEMLTAVLPLPGPSDGADAAPEAGSATDNCQVVSRDAQPFDIVGVCARPTTTWPGFPQSTLEPPLAPGWHASKRLNRMIGLGQLVRQVEGRRIFYQPTQKWMPPSEDITARFWTQLAAAFPGLSYIHIAALVGPHPRTRKSARKMIWDRPRGAAAASTPGCGARPSAEFIVFDFHGVRDASDAFLEELVNRGVEQGALVRWINVPQHVRDQAAGRPG